MTDLMKTLFIAPLDGFIPWLISDPLVVSTFAIATLFLISHWIASKL